MSRFCTFGHAPMDSEQVDHEVFKKLLEEKHKQNPDIRFYYKMSSSCSMKFDIYVIDPNGTAIQLEAWSQIRDNRRDEDVIADKISLFHYIKKPENNQKFHEWKIDVFSRQLASFTDEEINAQRNLLLATAKGRRGAIIPSPTNSEGSAECSSVYAAVSPPLSPTSSSD